MPMLKIASYLHRNKRSDHDIANKDVSHKKQADQKIKG